MKQDTFIVFIVDDDARVREALTELLEAVGWHAAAFGSAGEYLSFPRPPLPACLILDVELPDINGLEFQKQISDGGHPPIVFLTGHGDIPSSVRAIKHGAVDFLTKPFTEQSLLAAIEAAVERDRIARAERVEIETLQRRLDSLTPRALTQLKAIVTAETIDERDAYSANRESRVHIASFCATGNNRRFLTDLTGNRRWLPFYVTDIDSPYTHAIPHERLYAQA